MIRRPPRSTRTDTLFPYTTLFRSGLGQDVALLHPAEPVDRRAVEPHALVEGALQLGRRDGEGLELTQHVGEPEPDESDPPLLDGPQDVVTLALHDRMMTGRGPGANSAIGAVHRSAGSRVGEKCERA